MSNKGSSYTHPSAADHLMQFLDAQRKSQIRQLKSSEERVKELLGEDTVVKYNGEPVYNLNSSLVLRQGLDISELRNLKSLHAEKLKYFDLMRETDDREKLKEYAREIECIEFEMQKNWHFNQDRNFHEWYKVPKCTCPKMDNSDNRGSSSRVIVMDCPVHGE